MGNDAGRHAAHYGPGRGIDLYAVPGVDDHGKPAGGKRRVLPVLHHSGAAPDHRYHATGLQRRHPLLRRGVGNERPPGFRHGLRAGPQRLLYPGGERQRLQPSHERFPGPEQPLQLQRHGPASHVSGGAERTQLLRPLRVRAGQGKLWYDHSQHIQQCIPYQPGVLLSNGRLRHEERL